MQRTASQNRKDNILYILMMKNLADDRVVPLCVPLIEDKFIPFCKWMKKNWPQYWNGANPPVMEVYDETKEYYK